MRTSSEHDAAVGFHIAAQQPAAVLAWIEADRQILDEHATIDPGEDWAHCRRCQDHNLHDAMNAPCRTVRLLAVRHAGRPGYQKGWRP